MGQVYSWMQKKIMNENERFEFGDKLQDFGYHFNADGQLRSIDGNEPFTFQVREKDYNYNQQHYDALGDAVTEEVNSMMEKKCRLQKTNLPMDAGPDEPKTYVYISGDLYTNTEKLMILVHGSGAVRAGQWSRRLIINDNLEKGSQLPFIEWGRNNGYSIIVANTNLNLVDERKKKTIRGNGTPEEHVESIWRELVQRSPAKHIVFVAHSYGGVCTAALCLNHIREFEERVFAIVLTDSVHGLRHQPQDQEVIDFFKERAMNWASAYDPLDAKLQTPRSQCPTVSAGTDVHELTSYTSMGSIFKYIPQKYEQRVNPEKYRKQQEELAAEKAKQAEPPKQDEPQGLLVDITDETKGANGNQADGALANQLKDVQISQESTDGSERKWEKFEQEGKDLTENSAPVEHVTVNDLKTDDVKVEL